MENIMLRGKSFTLFCANLILVYTDNVKQSRKRPKWTLRIVYQSDNDIVNKVTSSFSEHYYDEESLLKDYRAINTQIDNHLNQVTLQTSQNDLVYTLTPGMAYLLDEKDKSK